MTVIHVFFFKNKIPLFCHAKFLKLFRLSFHDQKVSIQNFEIYSSSAHGTASLLDKRCLIMLKFEVFVPLR